MDRRIRKVTVYVCTSCYAGFPSKEEAKDHWTARHQEPQVRRPRGRPRKDR